MLRRIKPITFFFLSCLILFGTFYLPRLTAQDTFITGSDCDAFVPGNLPVEPVKTFEELGKQPVDPNIHFSGAMSLRAFLEQPDVLEVEITIIGLTNDFTHWIARPQASQAGPFFRIPLPVKSEDPNLADPESPLSLENMRTHCRFPVWGQPQHALNDKIYDLDAYLADNLSLVAWHDTGHKGQGITVGIVDTCYESYADFKAGKDNLKDIVSFVPPPPPPTPEVTPDPATGTSDVTPDPAIGTAEASPSEAPTEPTAEASPSETPTEPTAEASPSETPAEPTDEATSEAPTEPTAEADAADTANNDAAQSQGSGGTLSVSAIPQEAFSGSQQVAGPCADDGNDKSYGHGTNVIRILHRIVPDAMYYPVQIQERSDTDQKADTNEAADTDRDPNGEPDPNTPSGQFQKAVRHLLDQNVDIIVYAGNPLDTNKKPYYQAVMEALGKNVLWVNSAGNVGAGYFYFDVEVINRDDKDPIRIQWDDPNLTNDDPTFITVPVAVNQYAQAGEVASEAKHVIVQARFIDMKSDSPDIQLTVKGSDQLQAPFEVDGQAESDPVTAEEKRHSYDFTYAPSAGALDARVLATNASRPLPADVRDGFREDYLRFSADLGFDLTGYFDDVEKNNANIPQNRDFVPIEIIVQNVLPARYVPTDRFSTASYVYAPADLPGVLTVGSYERALNELAWNSSRSNNRQASLDITWEGLAEPLPSEIKPNITAPNFFRLSDQPGDTFSDTSTATPIVAGAAILLLDRARKDAKAGKTVEVKTPLEIKSKIEIYSACLNDAVLDKPMRRIWLPTPDQYPEDAPICTLPVTTPRYETIAVPTHLSLMDPDGSTPVTSVVPINIDFTRVTDTNKIVVELISRADDLNPVYRVVSGDGKIERRPAGYEERAACASEHVRDVRKDMASMIQSINLGADLQEYPPGLYELRITLCQDGKQQEKTWAYFDYRPQQTAVLNPPDAVTASVEDPTSFQVNVSGTALGGLGYILDYQSPAGWRILPGVFDTEADAERLSEALEDDYTQDELCQEAEDLDLLQPSSVSNASLASFSLNDDIGGTRNFTRFPTGTYPIRLSLCVVKEDGSIGALEPDSDTEAMMQPLEISYAPSIVINSVDDTFVSGDAEFNINDGQTMDISGSALGDNAAYVIAYQKDNEDPTQWYVVSPAGDEETGVSTAQMCGIFGISPASEATEEPSTSATAEATDEAAVATSAPTDEADPNAAAETDATDEATSEADADATDEATEEADADATAEPNGEADADATDEPNGGPITSVGSSTGSELLTDLRHINASFHELAYDVRSERTIRRYRAFLCSEDQPEPVGSNTVSFYYQGINDSFTVYPQLRVPNATTRYVMGSMRFGSNFRYYVVRVRPQGGGGTWYQIIGPMLVNQDDVCAVENNPTSPVYGGLGFPVDPGKGVQISNSVLGVIQTESLPFALAGNYEAEVTVCLDGDLNPLPETTRFSLPGAVLGIEPISPVMAVPASTLLREVPDEAAEGTMTPDAAAVTLLGVTPDRAWVQVMLTDDQTIMGWVPANQIILGAAPITPPDGGDSVRRVRGYVFASDVTGTWHLYRASSSDGQQVQLTEGPSNNEYPSLSPDRTQIAFTSDRDGQSEIYVMSINGGTPQRLTVNAASDYRPVWSPSGDTLLFESDREGGVRNLFLLDVATQAVTPITLNGVGLPCCVSWSSDGQRIVYAASRDGQYDIFTTTVTSGEIINVSNDGSSDLNPSWQPGGNYIVFQSNRSDVPQIYRMNADGSDLLPLTSNEDGSIDPAWVGGAQIVFTQITDGQLDIYIMNVDGTQKSRLFADPPPNDETSGEG